MPFIIVRYGANEEHIYNPNCISSVLLSHIKKTTGFETVENVDLANELGDVIDLLSKPKEIAKKYLEERQRYILIKVQADADDESVPIYTSLLDEAKDKLKFSLLNQKTKGKDVKEGKGVKGKDHTRHESRPVALSVVAATREGFGSSMEFNDNSSIDLIGDGDLKSKKSTKKAELLKAAARETVKRKMSALPPPK